MKNVVLIPGDGVGPELVEATRKCIDASGASIHWIEKQAGASVAEKEQSLLPEHVLEEIKKTKLALKGPIITPIGKGFRSVNVALRQTLDLFACVRPCKTLPGIPSPFGDTKNIDIVIVRENTEDLYAGVEFEAHKEATQQLIRQCNALNTKQIPLEAGISIKAISEVATRRICKFSCEYAARNNRNKLTIVTKSNIMKYSDGLFLEVAKDEASKYDIECDHVLIDALCMKLVQVPESFDMLLLPNLYGDIVSDLCAGLMGGLGVAPGSNIGQQATVYEATHGAAPEFAGRNMLNPTALILCGIMLLRDIQEQKAADTLEQALFSVLQERKALTVDLLPSEESSKAVSTDIFTQEIINKL